MPATMRFLRGLTPPARLVLLLMLLVPYALRSADPPPPAIRVPVGFVIEKVAGPPLVEHPVMACFDDQGRLYVAESAGTNFKAAELLKQLPDRIIRLEDTDGDGKFDKSTVFADKLSFPQGVCWHDGALYVASPPSVWRFVDTDGDGKADKREELVSKFGFIGNAADVHGPVLGPDGRLWWCDGRHGHDIEMADGVKTKGKAARVFRMKSDGTDLEVFCGGGMDNPVEVAFTPEGEPIVTLTFLTDPKDGLRDGLLHAVEGGIYPKPHDCIREFKRTGDLLPPLTHMGVAAPSGIMRYRGAAFGREYHDNFFSVLFNMHKVVRHTLERKGATFQCKNQDFLVSADPDFHPTDVLEDADGSILVIDTGGWFRSGCPTSQVAKPEIKGAIYRIRKADAAKVEDPWGKKLEWAGATAKQLAQRLDDPRWAVRDRAIQALAKQGEKAVPALYQVIGSNPAAEADRNALWALARIEGPESDDAVRGALLDKELSVRLVAAYVAGLHRNERALPRLLDLVVSDEPPVRRECATALGRIRSKEAVPALLESLAKGGDRFLEHALIYALIQINDREGTLKGLADAKPEVRRAVLIALDQMPDGKLTRENVVPLLDTDDAALQQAVMTIVTTHPDWAPQLVTFIKQMLGRAELSQARQDVLRVALIAFATDPSIQDLVAGTLKDDKTPQGSRLLLLETMAQLNQDKLPAAWQAELGRYLGEKDENLVRQAVATVRARAITSFDESLLKLAQDAGRPADLRVAAAVVAAPRMKAVEPALFDFLLSQLDGNLPPLVRLSAADAIGHARLADPQLETLAKPLASAGALELPSLVAAFEKSRNPVVGKNLLAALDRAPGLPALLPERLRQTLKDYPQEIRDAAASIFKKLEVDTEKMKVKLIELEPVLTIGDVKRGKDVFFGKKAACSTCHLVAGQGGQIGPDLTKIGGIRTGRDLLEAVVFPSASFARGFEPFVVATTSGQVFTGILKRETADAIFLVNTERAEIRIRRKDIDQFEPGRVSIMPQGLDSQLTKQALGDLIAFLVSLK